MDFTLVAFGLVFLFLVRCHNILVKMGRVGGLGAKLLVKMGWKEGTCLGVNGDGLTEPIRTSRRLIKPKNDRVEKKTEGLGRKKANDQWWEQLMVEAYGAPNNGNSVNGNSVDLFSACEGRRCRPHGTAKLARLDEQENSANPKNGELDEKLNLGAVEKSRLESISVSLLDTSKKPGEDTIQLDVTRSEVEETRENSPGRGKRGKKLKVKLERTIVKKKKSKKVRKKECLTG